MEFKVKVENAPKECEKWIVARFDVYTNKLWWWGSWDSEERAREIAKTIDGVVLERMD